MPEVIDRLKSDIEVPLKNRFVGREEVIDLITLAAVAGEHLFLLGPPGTAKSAIIRAFAQRINGRYFEYLLTRFSEPNELFGPIDLAKLRDGVVATVTTGMLPEAEFVFLDELFNANSAILNNLLTILNERLFRRGLELMRLPLISLFSASNRLPEDEALSALFDRFLLRCRVDSLPRAAMPALLAAGWQLERGERDPSSGIDASDMVRLREQCLQVNLTGIMEAYAEVVFHIRDLGVTLSDRRAVKLLKLIAASAVLCGRQHAIQADFWVLRYVWDREEQIGPLSGLIQECLRATSPDNIHPLASTPEKANPDAISVELDQLAQALSSNATLTELARLRERLSQLAEQASWVEVVATRQYLLERVNQLLNRLGETS